MKNTNGLIKEFKQSLLNDTGIELDFRKYQYLNNTYGLTPVFEYSQAEIIIDHLYKWAYEFIEKNKVNYPHFLGWEYNTGTALDSLRSNTLKSFIESVCNDLWINHVEQYRVENGKRFKYDPEAKTYIFDGKGE